MEKQRMTMSQYREILSRWEPNWRANRHTLLPWWYFYRERLDPTKDGALYWQRADGKSKVVVDPTMTGGVVLTQLLLADAETPMEAPDTLEAGQVWNMRWGHECGVDGNNTHAITMSGTRGTPHYMLLYGPTPWGPNVPWLDPALLPQEFVDIVEASRKTPQEVEPCPTP